MKIRPLLDGKLAREARASIDALSRALLRIGRASTREDLTSLGRGVVGLAVANAYLSPLFPERPHSEVVGHLLGIAFDVAAEEELLPSLFAGLAGLGWAVEHVRDKEEADPLGAVDAAFVKAVRARRWTGPYSLGDGLAGLAVYALERAKSPARTAILEGVVRHLTANAVEIPGGISWVTEPRFSPKAPEHRPPRHFSISMPYGMPGVIAVLGAIHAAGVARRDTRALLDGAVAGMLTFDREGIGFPRHQYIGHPPFMTFEPPSWCYGDLPVGTSLFFAGRAVKVRAWERKGLAILERAMTISPHHPRIRDAALTQGAGGVGHIFHRVYRATGEVRHARAARAWMARALELRKPGRGVAGYRAWMAIQEHPPVRGWLSEPGLLMGAGGTALALRASIADDDGAWGWDRCLLPAARGA